MTAEGVFPKVNGDILYASEVNGLVPIGTILPWLKDYTNTPALGGQFVECNGQTLSDSDSVYDGQTIPDLNVTPRFLRGSSVSNDTGGADTHTLSVDEMPAHTHTYTRPNYSTNEYCNGSKSGVTSTTGSVATSSTGGGNAHNNVPAYMSVVWIMRIK